MAGLDAPEVARLLTEYGQRLELSGENPYRARAYYKAAENFLFLTTPLHEVIAQDRLRDIPGVGPAIAAKIRNLHESGTDPALEAMRREIPAGVLEMLKIPGLRTQQILRIHKELEVASLEELESACRLDRLKDRKGLGAALQAKILEGLELMRRSHGQRLLHGATDILDRAIANLRRSHPDLERIAAAGDVRRGCEVVADLSVAA